MKTDAYTRVILTIIAICLTVIVLRDTEIIPAAQAATDRGEEVIKVQIVSIDESPNLRWETIPIKIAK